MRNICIVQPVLTNYVIPVFEELANLCNVDVLFSPASAEDSFGDLVTTRSAGLKLFPVRTVHLLGSIRLGMYQCGLIWYLVRAKPDALLIFANPRYFSFWTTLICARILGIPSYAHGHGLFKKERITFGHKLMYFLILRLVTSYVCYAPVVLASFLKYGFDEKKLSVAENSIVNCCPVAAHEKTGKELGVLFVGRLREGCEIGALRQAVQRLRDENGTPAILHVVGDGICRADLENAGFPPWIVHHGLIYDTMEIQRISRDCAVGCYPGNAGLSIVHYMSLSLVPVAHDHIAGHQGPEPAYISHGENGILFPAEMIRRAEHVYESLRSLLENPQRVKQLQKQAYETYCRLTTPSLAQRLFRIMFAGESIERE